MRIFWLYFIQRNQWSFLFTCIYIVLSTAYLDVVPWRYPSCNVQIAKLRKPNRHFRGHQQTQNNAEARHDVSTFFKDRGMLNFLMASRGNLSDPSIFARVIHIESFALCSLFLHDINIRVSIFIAKVLLSTIKKNCSLVKLKILRSSYSERKAEVFLFISQHLPLGQHCPRPFFLKCDDTCPDKNIYWTHLI